ALTAVAVAAGVSTAVATAAPKPAPNGGAGLSHRIARVNAELAQLSKRNDQLDEQYNVAAAAVAKAKAKAARAQMVADRAEAQYRTAHTRFVQALTEQYEDGPNPSA